MPLDPVALVLAMSFTAGCAFIHALRHHADTVTLALSLLVSGLSSALGSLLAARNGLLLSDPLHSWGLVAAANL